MSEILRRAVVLAINGVDAPPEAIRRQLEIERAPVTVQPALTKASVSRAIAHDKAQASRPASQPVQHFAPTRKRLAPISRAFDKMKVRPVPPGHKHEPAEKRFAVVGDVVYVREADWPALQQALANRRGAANEPRG